MNEWMIEWKNDVDGDDDVYNIRLIERSLGTTEMHLLSLSSSGGAASSPRLPSSLISPSLISVSPSLRSSHLHPGDITTTTTTTTGTAAAAAVAEANETDEVMSSSDSSSDWDDWSDPGQPVSMLCLLQICN